MSKPKRANRPGVGTQGATQPAARNGAGPTRVATSTRPANAGANGASKNGASKNGAIKTSATQNGTPTSRAATTGSTTNAARLESNGAASGTARVPATAATGRPIVSSIRQRTGTQRPAARKRYEVKKSWWQERLPIIIPTVSVVLLVALFALIANARGGGPNPKAVNSGVLSEMTNVSPATFAKVGDGGVKNPFTGLPSGSGLSANGKPEILYIGAEYCPYCAAERWSMVIALSRFGTFTGLQTMSSSNSDSFPSTNTFTFVKATYTSKYIVFVPKEIEDQSGKSLQTLTQSQRALFQQFDAPPYTTQANAGGIPFIDFGNQYITLSSGFSPALLHAGADPNGTPLTDTQIAGALNNPNNAVTQAIIGNANYLTAAICKLTNNQPGSVCNTSVIQQLEAQLPKNS